MFYLVFLMLLIMTIFFRHEKKSVLFISSIFLMGLIVFRYGYGADYFAYEHIYYRIKLGSLSNILHYYKDIGLGFKLLIVLFRTFKLPYHVFIVFINTVSLFFILKWIDDNSKDKILSILLFYSMFFFVWTFSALRQGLVLSIALYTLFNPKNKLSLKYEILIVLLLTFIHPSSMILLLYLLLDQIDWNAKKHLLFLGVSILVSLLPLYKIIPMLNKLPILSWFKLTYISDSVKFYDFPGLIRLGFFFLVFYFYYQITQKKQKHFVDRFLYGVSLYFMFKFSEIAASRLTIYSFISLILIIPFIYHRHERYRLKPLGLLVIVAFSSAYFYKEVNTLAFQSSHLPSLETNHTKFESIFSKNIDNFGTDYAFEMNAIKRTEKVLNQLPKLKQVDYDKEDTYVVVKHKKNFIIINQKGEQLEDYNFKREPMIYKDVVIDTYYQDGYYFPSKSLIDLSGKNRSDSQLKKIISESMEKETFYQSKEKYIRSNYEDIPDSLKSLYNNEESIKRVYLNKIHDDIPYHMMRVDYHKSRAYLYLDENMNLLLDIPFKNARPFNNEDIIALESFAGLVYINKEGQVIWWENQ